jgi:hypothetical protein
MAVKDAGAGGGAAADPDLAAAVAAVTAHRAGRGGAQGWPVSSKGLAGQKRARAAAVPLRDEYDLFSWLGLAFLPPRERCCWSAHFPAADSEPPVGSDSDAHAGAGAAYEK